MWKYVMCIMHQMQVFFTLATLAYFLVPVHRFSSKIKKTHSNVRLLYIVNLKLLYFIENNIQQLVYVTMQVFMSFYDEVQAILFFFETDTHCLCSNKNCSKIARRHAPGNWCCYCEVASAVESCMLDVEKLCAVISHS